METGEKTETDHCNEVEAFAVCEEIQRLEKPAMVQSFVFRRNNNSAVCLKEENCEETTRISVQ